MRPELCPEGFVSILPWAHGESFGIINILHSCQHIYTSIKGILSLILSTDLLPRSVPSTNPNGGADMIMIQINPTTLRNFFYDY